jgi:hypothetical protein
MPSRVSMAELKGPGMSVGARICLVLVGVCVVVGTAVIVVIGSSDDPREATSASTSANVGASTNANPSANPSASAGASASASEVASAVPVVAAVPEAPAPVPAPADPVTPSRPVAVKNAGAKPKPASSAPLKGVALPPNPFGGSQAPPLPGKRK